MKSTEEIIQILLKEKCVESLKNSECIASDTVHYVLKNPKYFEDYYELWLVRHGFAVGE